MPDHISHLPTTNEGFVALYEYASPTLLAFFARRTLDAQTAADLTSETFAAAFAGRARFDAHRGSPLAWLWGIAQHQLDSYLRRAYVREAARRAVGITTPILTDEDIERVDSMVDLASIAARLKDALAELGRDQRRAVTLRVLEGLDYSAIAAELNCTESAARARVSRGLRQLATKLGPSSQSWHEAGGAHEHRC